MSFLLLLASFLLGLWLLLLLQFAYGKQIFALGMYWFLLYTTRLVSNIIVQGRVLLMDH